MTHRILTGRTPDDLIRKIYAIEGWTFKEGENRVARCKTLYSFSADVRRNRYIATPIEHR